MRETNQRKGRKIMTADQEQMVRKLGDLTEHSEGMFRGHHVERFVTGYWVDHKGPMRLEEAVEKVLVSVNEPFPTWFPCDI